jgi:hypothetical protein
MGFLNNPLWLGIYKLRVNASSLKADQVPAPTCRLCRYCSQEDESVTHVLHHCLSPSAAPKCEALCLTLGGLLGQSFARKNLLWSAFILDPSFAHLSSNLLTPVVTTCLSLLATLFPATSSGSSHQATL